MAKTFRDSLNERLQDAAFRIEWEALEPERQITMAIIEGRTANHLTQEQQIGRAHV